MPQTLLAVMSVAAILMIGNVLIICHELGHYLAARANGLVAERFTIGVGPNLFRLKDHRGTVWSLSTLPVGGFVAFAGERDRSRAGGYAALRPTARMMIILAGPAANMLVAIGLYACILAGRGETTLLPIATTIAAGSPAARAGLKQGDLIVAADGAPIVTFADLGAFLKARPDQTVDLRIDRQGAQLDLKPRLEARHSNDHDIGYLGIEAHTQGYRQLGLGQILLLAPARAWTVLSLTVTGIFSAVTTGQGAGQFTGMIGVAHLAGEAAASGPIQLLALTALLSVNLALMNLLPIPVLDGGAFLFCLFEWIAGRPASARVQELATRTGVAAIAGLFALSTFHDLAGFGLFQWLPK
ncbi:M50 family metallopeptidase [Acidisoma silvae]|uniref:Site-2 protease family protein n=1 Tax=Acidisoma silvae TaxID=2802396 RepID=A0A964E0R2_9PROT|nr:M50 family metallopeptidase [Acidisoma silvae]MCB8877424.1 site-2 protease family protein [Acidisoma silvae]